MMKPVARTKRTPAKKHIGIGLGTALVIFLGVLVWSQNRSEGDLVSSYSKIQLPSSLQFKSGQPMAPTDDKRDGWIYNYQTTEPSSDVAEELRKAFSDAGYQVTNKSENVTALNGDLQLEVHFSGSTRDARNLSIMVREMN